VTDVPIYNSKGVQVDSFFIDDKIVYVDGRVSKGDKCYYKGAGIPYKAHHVRKLTDEYLHEYTCDVFYIGECVRKKVFIGKTGVFQEPFQPHFTDWIGACGEKEIQIVENLWEMRFDRSAIEVFGFEEITPGQYYLMCNYPEGRHQYLDNPNASNLFTLIAYMTDNNWNFPWDKRSISDINPSGKVTDVADVFHSERLVHKVGSIYSVLYSLAQTDRARYVEFCERYMLPFDRHVYFVTNTLSLLQRLGVDIEPCMRDNIVETYKHTVRNYLVPGKNCGYCGVGSCKNRTDTNQSEGEAIRDEYIKIVEQSLQN
jgi:hypothetical protein